MHLETQTLIGRRLQSSGHRSCNCPATSIRSAHCSRAPSYLTVLASRIDGEVSHYRDSNNKEIDAIITLPDRRWGAVEVKLGGQQLTAGATSLQAVIAQVDIAAIGEPAFRLVVTGTGPILVTDDGTITAPLTALAP